MNKSRSWLSEETNKNGQYFRKDAQEKKIQQIKREHNIYTRD